MSKLDDQTICEACLGIWPSPAAGRWIPGEGGQGESLTAAAGSSGSARSSTGHHWTPLAGTDSGHSEPMCLHPVHRGGGVSDSQVQRFKGSWLCFNLVVFGFLSAPLSVTVYNFQTDFLHMHRFLCTWTFLNFTLPLSLSASNSAITQTSGRIVTNKYGSVETGNSHALRPK